MAHETCPHCEASSVRKYGRRYDGRQRYQCKECKATFSDCKPLHPVIGKLDKGKAVMAIRCLLEGCSVRSTERLTGITKKSILRLLVRAGERCRKISDKYLQELDLEHIQADELWNFVYAKDKTLKKKLKGAPIPKELGSQFTFLGMESSSKLIVTYAIGKRDGTTAAEFVSDLASRLSEDCKTMLVTDGFAPYVEAVEQSFGGNVDFAQLIKLFQNQVETGRERYTPGGLAAITKKIICGDMDEDLISTSYVERLNLSCRMEQRRFTRLTNAFSKKLENLKAAVQLWVAAFNFTRIHRTLSVTPAMEAGVVGTVWSVEELLGVA